MEKKDIGKRHVYAEDVFDLYDMIVYANKPRIKKRGYLKDTLLKSVELLLCLESKLQAYVAI